MSNSRGQKPISVKIVWGSIFDEELLLTVPQLKQWYILCCRLPPTCSRSSLSNYLVLTSQTYICNKCSWWSKCISWYALLWYTKTYYALQQGTPTILSIYVMIYPLATLSIILLRERLHNCFICSTTHFTWTIKAIAYLMYLVMIHLSGKIRGQFVMTVLCISIDTSST